MAAASGLDAIRDCLEGVIPSVIATVAADGTPNITYVSQVHYVDARHVALSFQFFNKTRDNILANPHAMVQVVDPVSGAHYRLSVRYLRTETEGPLFERMRAMLAGIASHTGMARVFRLLGADLYEVLSIQGLTEENRPGSPPAYNRLTALRTSLQRLAGTNDLDGLFDTLLHCLAEQFHMPHALLLMADAPGRRLYTVASQGYPVSGIGAEIPFGAGLIGVAAEQRTPIRITYLTGAYSYNLAVRDSLREENPGLELETEIPFAGLEHPHSQLAVPIVLHEQLLGLLYVDSEQDLRFSHEDEEALVSLNGFLALFMGRCREGQERETEQSIDVHGGTRAAAAGSRIRHFAANDSIFIDGQYLIKGVAGAILWKLLRDFSASGRTEFSNRELRLDPAIGLPDIGDNLEARLILLRKRLRERCAFLRMERTGRGRFQLRVDRAIDLEEA